MKMMNTLLENESIMSYLQENEARIYTASEQLGSFPEVVKRYIVENMQDFIGADVKETYANMVIFTESAVSQYMHELCNQITE